MTAVYGLPHCARALCTQDGEKERIRFFAGTCSLRDDNELHLVEAKVEDNISSLDCIYIFSHPNEIWSISSCPSNSKIVGTIHKGTESSAGRAATIWRMEDGTLESGFTIAGDGEGGARKQEVRKLLWDPANSKPELLLALHRDAVGVWDTEVGSNVGGKLTAKLDLGMNECAEGAWNPHFGDEIATTYYRNVYFWDIRTMKEKGSIPGAHAMSIRNLCFNNNKPYVLSTCGDDSLVKFWDYRHLQKPLCHYQAHHHWIWNVRLHSCLDQLVLTSGTDGHVKLWNVNVSPMSSGQERRGKEPARSQQHMNLVKTYEDHEDSVYGLCWTSSTDVDTWTFASMSYDGRVVLNRV
eukprot:CAMPEP_0119135256 /NCGR_PEP_ID=MMETSP1310-20130426/18925_1 /TAXON_ID=464262 /ORGANISM="Genus nov. species nov., Strain RCC2339" /LENGTH=351 /DNA_ID=CAMNT_0007126123 /DNA_START=42 /DNA_END=1093 /DNA_ORIENTATION=-